MRVSNIGWKITGLLGFTAIVLLTIVYLYTLAGGRLPGYDPYKANAVVPDALNLVNNSDVRRDGIKIGRVTGAEPLGQSSKVAFEIDDSDQDDVYRDATVRVRTKTLVGESYLDVDPGTPGQGRMPEGSTLPMQAAKEVVPLERILSTVDPETRRSIQRNLRGVGGGLEGRGQDLNRLFAAVKPVVADGGRLMEALAPQRRQLATLVDDYSRTMGAFGSRTQQLRGLVVDAKRTAEVAATRDEKIAESFEELPATLSQARTTVADLSGFAGRATPVFSDLKSASLDLAPTLSALQPAAAAGRQLFRELPAFLDQAEPLLAELTPAAGALRKVMPPLDGVLRQANPALKYLRPYAPELAAFFSNSSQYFSKDDIGSLIRVHAMAGDSTFANEPKAVRDLIKSMVEAGGFQKFFNLRDNAYPRPGTVGKEQSFDGQYERVGEAGG